MQLKVKVLSPLVALAIIGASMFGQSVAQDSITITAVGAPSFDITNSHVFAAATDIFPVLLPSHFPRSVHAPPYGQEFADGLSMNGITESNAFSIADFTDPSAVHLAYVLEPNGTAPTGASPDYGNGPIIQNPINITGDVYLNGEPFELNAFNLRPAPAAGIDGASHYVIDNWENSSFAPAGLESLIGDYEYRIKLRDAVNNSGYDMVAGFSVVPEPASVTLLAIGAIFFASLSRCRRP